MANISETVDPGAAKRELKAAAEALKIEKHWLAAAKAMRNWDDLFPVSDAELLAAVDEAKNVRLA